MKEIVPYRTYFFKLSAGPHPRTTEQMLEARPSLAVRDQGAVVFKSHIFQGFWNSPLTTVRTRQTTFCS